MLDARHIKLGRISFDDALVLQERAISEYQSSVKGLPIIYSLEHEPVITCGHSSHDSNLLLSESEYLKRGIAVRRIDRGGDVTYHGPGQVVVYPIFNIREYNLRPGEYVRLLEDSMISTCSDYGVEAFRKPGYVGCWTSHGKIGAVGTSIKRGGITKHGIAFNVNTDLDNFSLIVPCGISKFPVTRLADLVDNPPILADVEDRLVKNIISMLDFRAALPAQTGK
jgi:lipoyl(octanoyl) transferase